MIDKETKMAIQNSSSFDESENALPSPDELMKRVNQLTKFIKGNCVDLDWRDATHLESEISTKARKILNINR